MTCVKRKMLIVVPGESLTDQSLNDEDHLDLGKEICFVNEKTSERYVSDENEDIELPCFATPEKEKMYINANDL